jgi:hypothetical protein
MIRFPHRVEVSPSAIRKMCNDGRFLERAAQGEFTTHVVADRHPSAPEAPVPYCTRSQEIVLRNQAGQEIAAFHQYLQPDRTLGASGRPDPKRLIDGNVLYVVWWSGR